MQTANETPNDAVTQCNLDCSPQACGRCTCRPAPHTTCNVHNKPSAYPKEVTVNYETEPVSKLKDEIWESLDQQRQAGADGILKYDPAFENAEALLDLLDLIGIADAIGNHLVETIFKDNDDYQINIDIDDR